MMHRNTHLGAIPAIAKRSAERGDVMLAHTGHAARKILRAIRKYPRAQRPAALNRALAATDPKLPGEVRRLAASLRAKGAGIGYALERALTLALADSTVRQIKGAGRLYQRRGGYPMGGMGGLGDEAGDLVGGIAQGVACAGGLRDQTATMVGMEEGADAAAATRLGFEILRGMAQCPPPVVPPVPPADPVDTSSSMAVPIMIGIGTLIAVGGVAWIVTRKK
jgi:hypothetical protein